MNYHIKIGSSFKCNIQYLYEILCVLALTGKLSEQVGWSGGAMVLGKLPVPGRPTNFDYSRARTYCAYSRCGWGLLGHFYSRLSFLFSSSISLGDSPI